MEKIPENISKKGIKIIIFALIIFLLIIAVFIYNSTNYIIVRFNELGPLMKNMPVYYSGFKVGKIIRIKPDNDYKHILVKVGLNQKIIIPQNTVVSVNSFPNGGLYLQFVYPSSPSLNMIRRGDMLEGIAPYSLEQFMMGQSVAGFSDVVSAHIVKALDSADAASQEMRVFFQVTSQLIKDNGAGITDSVNNTEAMTESLAEMAENLNQVAQNLNQTSRKINNSIDEKVLKDSLLNIKGSTSNIKDATGNIYKATKDIDKTMKGINDAVSQVNSAAENLNSITVGVKEALSKKFAGMRIMFGRPVKSKKYEKYYCK